MIKFLDLYAQYCSMKDEIDGAMRDILETSAFIGGAAPAAFEKEFAAYQQARYCVGVANGTDAIEIILEALDLPADAEVIVPANSFVGSSEPAGRRGLKVVFADVCPSTYTLNVADVARRITPKTRVIVAVHLYGHPCDMDGLQALADAHGLIIIEDCAQAHGAEYRGRRVGSIGVAGAFSFYPGKTLGAYGDAGAITTGNEELARRCRMIANHGRVAKYDHEFEGRNSRLDGMQAAVLRVKLRRVDGWIDHRNRLAAVYSSQLAGVGDLTLPVVAPACRHGFHLYVIRTARRDELMKFLTKREIQTVVHYPIALSRLPAYENSGQANEPMFANAASATLLSLPLGEHLDELQIGEVTSAIREFFAD